MPLMKKKLKDPDLLASNVRNGVNIDGVIGTLVDVFTDPDFVASNIRQGVDIVGRVGSLIEGKKWASGTIALSATTIAFVLRSGTNQNAFYVTVSGLTFLPSYILLKNASASQLTVYDARIASNGQIHASYIPGSTSNANENWIMRMTGNAYVNASGFQLPVPSNYEPSFDWIAIE